MTPGRFSALLIEANGQLGSELRQAFQNHDLVPPTHEECELTDRVQVGRTLQKYRPTLILNTAAYHRIDECEDQPEQAFAVNALTVMDLAIAARELARKVRQVVETGAYGLYHITNNGTCSWYEFAAAAFEMAGMHPRLQETTSAVFGARATRPAYSVLDNANLRSLGLDDLRHWRNALVDYLGERQRLRARA